MLKNRIALMFAVAAAGVVAHGSSAQVCEWSALGEGTSGGYPTVRAMAAYDDGTARSLYVGGAFVTAGGIVANGIARWDGSAWTALGSGLSGAIVLWPFVMAMEVFDDGSGSALYVGGDFKRAGDTSAPHIARWDGAEWSAVGAFGHAVFDLAVFDDGTGPALYAAGQFETASGAPAGGVARWDGVQWRPLGEGIGGPTPSTRQVVALAVFDDGAGPALYAAGRFTTAGGEPATRIAKWDGMEWSPLGVGVGGAVLALTVYDDGTGEALYAGGFFEHAGGTLANRIAKWDGSAWSAVGGGVSGAAIGDTSVGALTVFDDGTGAVMYAAGNFELAGGQLARNIAKWDGENWSAVAGGLSGSGGSLRVTDIGEGPALYVGGDFDEAGGIEANHIARLGCERAGCYADCDGDGELTFFDFLCFQNLFVAGDPLADCDESGELDFFDFLCFQNAFAAGCE